MEQRIDKIEKALMNGSSQSLDVSSAGLDVKHRTSDALQNAMETNTPETPLRQMTDRPDRLTLNLSCSLGAFPASSIIDSTLLEEGGTSTRQPDLISRGAVSVEIADASFAAYKQHLDPCVHNVLADGDTLADVRARSALLTAAICTVASFYSGSSEYQSCFNAFTDEVSGKMFSEKYEFDDVRALCIGAFWLKDISSGLNGLGEYCLFVTIHA